MDKITEKREAVINQVVELLESIKDEETKRTDAHVLITMSQDGKEVIFKGGAHGEVNDLVDMMCNTLDRDIPLKDCIVIAVGALLMQAENNPVFTTVINRAINKVVDPKVMQAFLSKEPESEECNCPQCLRDRKEKAERIKNNPNIN